MYIEAAYLSICVGGISRCMQIRGGGGGGGEGDKWAGGD